MKLGAVKPLGRTIHIASCASSRATIARQFTCTALRAKEVASQEDIPNLRHAPRPRECFWPEVNAFHSTYTTLQLVESSMPLSWTQPISIKKKLPTSTPTANTSFRACRNSSNNSQSGRMSSQYTYLRQVSFQSCHSSNITPLPNTQWSPT